MNIAGTQPAGSTKPLTLEATRRGGLRGISCQADKMLERKDTHRKPLLPNLPGS